MPALLFSILTPLFLPPSSVSLSYFILSVPMRECLGKHSCMSSPFPLAILNGTFFFRSVKAMNNWKRSAIKQILLLLSTSALFSISKHVSQLSMLRFINFCACTHVRYERLLRRSKTEDLREISGIGCLYQCGHDKLGRPIIVFIGKWFKYNEINLDKALLYLIQLLEPVSRGDYVIIYFHTLTANENHPALTWIRHVYEVLDYK